MKIVILDAGTLGDLELSGLPEDCEIYSETSEEELLDRCYYADIIVTNKVELREKSLLKLKKLKAIIVLATGTNNIDVKYAQSNGVKVLNAQGYSTQSVVSHTFAMAFYFLQDIAHYQKFTSEGNWMTHPHFSYFKKFSELGSLTWTVIGLGTIGKAVAECARSFGCQVNYISTSGQNNNQDFKRVTLLEAFGESDIISIHAPLNDKTRNLIGKAQLVQMKKDHILLNLGRGGIINEEDLSQFLDQNNEVKIGLDVLDKEPMSERSPLKKHLSKPNLLITPHIAWASKESRENLWKITLGNINKVIANS